MLRRILRCCSVGKDSEGPHIEKNLGGYRVLEDSQKLLVEKDPEGCCHIGKDSHGLSCQKDSEGLSVEKNLRGRHVGKNLSSCSGGSDSERTALSEGF